MTLSARADSGWSVLRAPGFARFAIARFASAIGLQMIVVGVGWMVYDLTGSALALGLVGLAIFLPTISLALVTGHVADAYDRARVVAICFGLIALICMGLVAFVLSGSTNVNIVYGLLALMGASRAFANPATQALLPSVVSKEQFPSALAFNSSLWQIAVVAGPSAGGLLYILGPAAVFITSALCLALGAILVASLAGVREPVKRERPTWSSLIAGLSFIRSRPAIMGAITLDLFAVLLGGAAALMPIYARDILHTGPWGLGLLRSCPAIGSFIVGIYLTQFPIRRNAGVIVFSAVGVFGLMTIGFGLSQSLPLSMLFLTIMGAADILSVYVRQNLVQLETPDAMRGRVSAVNTVFIGASNELGDFESGVVAAMVGPVAAVVLGGVGTIAVAVSWAWLFPALRKRNTLAE